MSVSVSVEAECEAAKKQTCQDQMCAKINGTDTCTCKPGYQLASDGTTCNGKNKKHSLKFVINILRSPFR